MVRDYSYNNRGNNLKLSGGILRSDDVKELITEKIELFFFDVKSELDCLENLKLAIYQGVLVNSEGRCIMDVILEAISIFIDEESFLIVFVCQKKAGAVEPIKSVSIKRSLLL